MSYVDPSFAPTPGIYVAANGRVLLEMDGEDETKQYELLRIQRAFIRISNSIQGYAQTGSQNIITYKGSTIVTGSISRAYVNLMEMRLVTGDKNSTVNTLEGFETSMSSGLNESVSSSGKENRGGVFDLNRYPAKKLSVGLMVNDQILQGGEISELSKAFMIKANWVLFDNAQVAFDARNLVRSDGLRFVASYPTYHLVDIEPGDGTSTELTA